MKKKKGGGGGANWMDTYGDMVTLLLCFFVLLYSMSTIDTDKWKALVMSFNPAAVMEPAVDVNGTDGPINDPNEPDGQLPLPILPDGETQEDIDKIMDALYQALQNYTQSEGLQDTIAVSRDGSGRIFVSFKETAFFEPEQWALRTDAYPVLDHVCEMLSQASDAIDQVRIQGHTAQATMARPNNPKNDRFLASNRATNVLVYIQEHSSVDPARLVSEGYGQWQPVDTNETSEGRANNRRVELIISGRNLEEELELLQEQYDSESGTSISLSTTDPNAE